MMMLAGSYKVLLDAIPRRLAFEKSGKRFGRGVVWGVGGRLGGV